MQAAQVVTGALLIAECIVLVPLAYLALLSLGALVARLRPARSVAADETALDHYRFAILIPAHDEASTIAGVLASVAALDYPPALCTPIVVADNCSDETAARARAAGALVYERTDPHDRAKGYALRWLFARLAEEQRTFDGYIIVDADSRLSRNFLHEMARALASGAQVAQAQYRVANEGESWMSGLRALAFALFNHVRPAGRALYGWSAGLKGNGMCFSPAVLERFGWGAYSLAEDAEYHLALVRAGIRVRYMPGAIVAAEMPTTLRQARSQQARWERGRLALVRAHVPGLLLGTLRHADLARLDAAMEVALPPLSLMVGLVVASALGAALLGSAAGLWLATAMVAALALHLLAGALLARLTPRAYLSLLYAPGYILWKCWVYLLAIVRPGSGRWVRTERATGRSADATNEATLAPAPTPVSTRR